MNRNRLRGLTVMVGLFLYCALANAQSVQRLFVPRTNLRLGPDGTAEISTLCSDFGIPGPKAGQQYNYLLSGNDSIRVRIGGTAISLNDAIAQGKIRLETPRATVNDYITNLERFHRLDPSSVSAGRIRSDRAILEGMSTAQQARILAGEQNPNRLRIVNLSGEPLIFESDGAMLGTSDQASAHVPEPVRQSTSSDKPPSQEQLWISQMQSALSAAGYSVTVDGVMGKETRAALLDFQREHGLAASGAPTSATAKKLRELRVETSRPAASALAANGDFFVLRVENNPEATNQFRIIAPDGTEVYTGSRRNELIDAIAAAAAPAGKQKYLDLHNFSQTQQENLAASFRTYADVVALPHDTMSLPNEASMGELVTKRGITLANPEPRIEEIQTPGPRQGWFRMMLDFIVQMGQSAKSLTMEVFARSRPELLAFLEGARGATGAAANEQDAIALFVARGRRHVISTFGDAHTVDILITKTQTRRVAEESDPHHSVLALGF